MMKTYLSNASIRKYRKAIRLLLIASLTGILFFPLKNKELPMPDDPGYPIWLEMMESPGVKIEDAREAFDSYWSRHSHYKGDRSKQFEQWYAINSRRLDGYGNVISASHVKREYQRMRATGMLEQQGQWHNYG
ncbi:hypothetical protein, partial [Snuella lapsa]|uniref:hypothetical protein n=1 Tax=Snuella lapsa TaxID=870481 RepID=UPI0031EDE1D2